MNPNGHTNHGQMPLSVLMNMMMGGMPPQSLPATQTQASPGMLQMQPPQPGSAPTFELVWQGWQQGGQQWLPMAYQGSQTSQPVQTPQGLHGAAAANSSHQSSARRDLEALVSALQPLLQNAPSTPVGTAADDERILVRALRDGKAEGLTPRQALEKLHNVSELDF